MAVPVQKAAGQSTVCRGQVIGDCESRRGFQRWARIQFVWEQDEISTINNFAYCQSDSDEVETRLYPVDKVNKPNGEK